MLTLTRRPNESIILETSDGNVVIIVSAIKGNQVKISIGAPDDVEIWREEIFEESTA